MRSALAEDLAQSGELVITRYVEPRCLALTERQFDEGADGKQRIIRDVVVSTEAIDSHRSILKLDGWDLQRYAENPVLDWMHASTSPMRPTPDELIGQALTKKLDRALGADLVFFPDELSNIAGKIYLQMKARMLRGLSVSFLPRAYDFQLEMPDGSIVDEPDLDSEAGFKEYVSMMRAGAKELLVVRKQELVAIGVVIVPSNPQTLSNGIAGLRELNPRRVQAQHEAARRKSAPVQVRGAALHRKAVAFVSYPLKEGSWDGDAAVGRVRAASTESDGSIDWNKFGRAFAYYDEGAPDEFGSYKLPHHDIADGEWVTIKAGVIAAGNAMQGARGGVDLPEADVAAVRAHLTKHYEEFEMVAPWDAESASAQASIAAADLPQEGLQMEIESTPAEPVVTEQPEATVVNRMISEEVKTNAMKAGAVCVDAIAAANTALESGDEETARNACLAAADASNKCRAAYADIAPVETIEEPVMEDVVAASWVRELTGKEDEPSQRGVVEAWRKLADAGELAKERAMVAKLQLEVEVLRNGTREEQLRKLLDAAERKITPAERKSYEEKHYKEVDGKRAFVGTVDDLTWLRSHFEALPERVELAPPTVQPEKPQSSALLSDEERSVAKQFRMTPEQFLEHKRTLMARDGNEDDDE